MTDMRVLTQYSKRIPLFQGLDAEDLNGLLDGCERFVIPRGKTICHKGQCGDSLFVVLKGCVNIYDEEDRIGRCCQGDAFGEIAALDHRVHAATAVSANEVTLIAIREAQINRFMKKRHAVRLLLNVIHSLSEQIVKANRRIAGLKKQLHDLEKAGKTDPPSPLQASG